MVSRVRLIDGFSNLVNPDSNAQLRSQQLNSDGTPKRPMNAFMIFARKRRPQISAANQMMRTGDISKILSKEWNTMDMVSLATIHQTLMALIRYGIVGQKVLS